MAKYSSNRDIAIALEMPCWQRLGDLETENGVGLEELVGVLRLGRWQGMIAVTWLSSTYLDK
jgi:hypothetical protein